MNTHKNTNKQGEKILLGGVAAAALGLINAKPQTVKAANQNGTRATKKTASRAVKTKLTYQTEAEGEAASNYDPTDQASDSQSNSSETNNSASNSAPETGQVQAGANNNTANENSADAVADNTIDPSTTDDPKANKQEADHAQFDSVNAIRDSNTTISSTWEDIPITFNNGILSIGEKGKTYTINNSDNKDISIGSNIDNVSGTDITEIDINAPIAIIGSACLLYTSPSPRD